MTQIQRWNPNSVSCVCVCVCARETIWHCSPRELWHAIVSIYLHAGSWRRQWRWWKYFQLYELITYTLVNVIDSCLHLFGDRLRSNSTSPLVRICSISFIFRSLWVWPRQQHVFIAVQLCFYWWVFLCKIKRSRPDWAAFSHRTHIILTKSLLWSSMIYLPSGGQFRTLDLLFRGVSFSFHHSWSHPWASPQDTVGNK